MRNLPHPGDRYNQSHEALRNQALTSADKLNRKIGQHVEIARQELLILSSPNGTRWKIEVSDLGFITAVAL